MWRRPWALRTERCAGPEGGRRPSRRPRLPGRRGGWLGDSAAVLSGQKAVEMRSRLFRRTAWPGPLDGPAPRRLIRPPPPGRMRSSAWPLARPTGTCGVTLRRSWPSLSGARRWVAVGGQWGLLWQGWRQVWPAWLPDQGAAFMLLV